MPLTIMPRRGWLKGTAIHPSQTNADTDKIQRTATALLPYPVLSRQARPAQTIHAKEWTSKKLEMQMVMTAPGRT